MDVGDPNNFPRLQQLHNNQLKEMKMNLTGYDYNNDQIKHLIKKCKSDNHYLLDPHGATGYGSLVDYHLSANEVGIFLETAHPAKFREEVEPIIGEKLVLPKKLHEFDQRTIKTDELEADYNSFKGFLVGM